MKHKLILSTAAFLLSGFLYGQKLPGTADSTFKGNGYGIYDFADKHAQLGSGFVGQNGKLVVIGGSIDNSNKWDAGLTRVNLDGSPDMSFRLNSGPSHIDFNSGENDFFKCFARSSDGGVVAVGGYTGQNGTDLLIVKFNEEGTVQTNFGFNGVNRFEISTGYEVATHVIVDQNNRTVILGNLPTIEKKMFMIRLFPYGGIDSSFAKDGVLLLDPLDRNNIPVALMERPKGGYYVVCNTTGNSESLISVVSVSNNGNYNIDLGGPGMVNLKVDGNDASASDAAYHNGSIFICGDYDGPQGNNDGFLARLETDGTWNSTFAGNGLARIVHNLANPYDEEVSSMVIAPDSSIFIVSTASTPDTTTLIQSRFKSDGNVEGLYGNKNGSHYDFAIADSVYDFTLYDLVLDTGARRLYILGNQSAPNQSGFFIYATYTGEFKQASGGGGTSGIHQKASQLRVYPNPASTWLQLELPESEGLEVQLFDLKGTVVMRTNSSLVDVKDLKSGIYFIRAVQNNQLYTAKIQVLDK